jgi:hypothetical protein
VKVIRKQPRDVSAYGGVEAEAARLVVWDIEQRTTRCRYSVMPQKVKKAVNTERALDDFLKGILPHA